MPSTREKLAALRRAADERGLTPVSWWIGRAQHETACEELAGSTDVRTEAGRLVEIDGLDVKLLSETPDRFALWCEEGVLDL